MIKLTFQLSVKLERRMALLVILTVVFVVVALMVILGERFGKPMTEEQQGKYGKTIPILVFILLIAAIIKGLV